MGFGSVIHSVDSITTTIDRQLLTSPLATEFCRAKGGNQGQGLYWGERDPEGHRWNIFQSKSCCRCQSWRCYFFLGPQPLLLTELNIADSWLVAGPSMANHSSATSKLSPKSAQLKEENSDGCQVWRKKTKKKPKKRKKVCKSSKKKNPTQKKNIFFYCWRPLIFYGLLCGAFFGVRSKPAAAGKYLAPTPWASRRRFCKCFGHLASLTGDRACQHGHSTLPHGNANEIESHTLQKKMSAI